MLPFERGTLNLWRQEATLSTRCHSEGSRSSEGLFEAHPSTGHDFGTRCFGKKRPTCFLDALKLEIICILGIFGCPKT